MYVSVSERFIKCVEYLIESRKLRNQAELVRSMGLSKGYVSQLMSGKREPSETIVSNLCARFLELNPQWIMTGEGEMLQDAGPRPGNEFVDPDTVPLLPIFAQAGHLTEWSEGIEEAKCERVISPVKGIDMAIHIYGESMSPDIPNGAVCYVRRITGRVIDYGRAYILDTVDGPVVKYLRPGSDDDHLLLESANKDPRFASYEVSKSDILGMYRVVMCMKMM